MSNMNWNIYDSLKQDSGYQSKVRQREAELEYVTRMNDRAEKRAVEQAVSAEKVSAEMDILDKMIKGLENPDVDRVKGVEEEARKIIMDGVKAANGDMKTFLLNGGHTKIREYKNTVMQSDTLIKAQKNANAMKAIKEDWRQGKMHDRVNINGEMITMNQAVNKFYSGEIDTLPLAKSYKAPTFNPAEFRKQYNPKDPHNSSLVDRETAIDYIVMKEGVSKDVASQVIDPMVNSQGLVENVWWGVKDGDNWKSNKSRHSNMGRNSKSGKGKNLTKEDFRTVISNARMLDAKNLNWETSDGMESVKMTRYNLSQKGVKEVLANHYDIGINADGSYRGGIRSMINATSLDTGKTFNLQGHAYQVMSVGSGMTVLQSFKKDKDGRPVKDAKGQYVADRDEMYFTTRVFMTEDAFDNMMDKQDLSRDDLGSIVNDYDENGLEGYTIDIGLFASMEDDALLYEIGESLNIGEVADYMQPEQQMAQTPWGTYEDVSKSEYAGREKAFGQIFTKIKQDNPTASFEQIKKAATLKLNQLTKSNGQ